MMMNDIQPWIQSGELSVKQETPYTILQVKTSILLPLCKTLYESKESYMDMLTCITGVDNGAEKGSIDVLYQLYSIPYDQHLTLVVTLGRDHPSIDTVSSIWKSANWMEREIFDMLGVTFIGHPDMRKILTPLDWVGFPLRKDYKPQLHYHNLSVMERKPPPR